MNLEEITNGRLPESFARSMRGNIKVIYSEQLRLGRKVLVLSSSVCYYVTYEY